MQHKNNCILRRDVAYCDKIKSLFLKLIKIKVNRTKFKK